MSQDIKAVSDAIKLIGDATGWQLVGAVTAAGTIAMAILQVFLVQQVDATTRTQLASIEMPERALQPAVAVTERSLPSRTAPFETA